MLLLNELTHEYLVDLTMVDWTGMTIPERNKLLMQMETKEMNQHFKLLEIPEHEQTEIRHAKRTGKNR